MNAATTCTGILEGFGTQLERSLQEMLIDLIFSLLQD